MAKLTLTDAENTAKRTRPWTFRLEGSDVSSGGQSFWYATGRGLAEAVEVGTGLIGTPPTHQLIDWPTLKTMVAAKLAEGFTYADTGFIRMSAVSLAKLATASLPVPTPVKPVLPPTPQQAVSTSLQALGEPFSLIRKLRLKREGTTILGYVALDEQGIEVMEFNRSVGLKFATDHEIEVEFG